VAPSKSDEETGGFLELNTKMRACETSPFVHEVIRLARDSHLRKQLYALHDGRDQPLPTRSGCMLLAAEAADGPLDPERLKRIIKHNAFKCKNVWDAGKTDGGNGCGTGVWGFPSLLNHSSLPNASHWFLGTAMVMHATKHVCMDEEVSQMYVSLSRVSDYKDLQMWGVDAKPPRIAVESEVLCGKIAQATTADEVRALVQTPGAHTLLEHPIGVRAFHAAAMKLNEMNYDMLAAARLKVEALRCGGQGVLFHAVNVLSLLKPVLSAHPVDGACVHSLSEAKSLAEEVHALLAAHCEIYYGKGATDAVRTLMESHLRAIV